MPDPLGPGGWAYWRMRFLLAWRERAHLRRKNKRLREALEPFARISRENPNWAPDDPAYLDSSDGLKAGDFHRAAAALAD